MSQQNRIIVPAKFSVEIVIEFDPRTGQSQMKYKNRSMFQLTTVQIAGLLAKNVSALLDSIITSTAAQPIKVDEPVAENKPNGDTNNAT